MSNELSSLQGVTPLSSDVLDCLLHRAALNSRLRRFGRPADWREADRLEIAPIGETAGILWQALFEGGPATFADLIDLVGVPESLFFMGVGWLAREDKIEIDRHGGDYEIRLK